MWALSYLACAFMKPDIFEGIPPLHGALLMFMTGVAGILGLAFTRMHARKIRRMGVAILFVWGILETMGGVASATGLIKWNIPFPDKAPFNVTMAFADLLAAAFLFTLVFGMLEEAGRRETSERRMATLMDIKENEDGLRDCET